MPHDSMDIAVETPNAAQNLLADLFPLDASALAASGSALSKLLSLPLETLQDRCNDDAASWLGTLADAISKLIHHLNTLAQEGETAPLWRWQALLHHLQTLSVLRYAGDANVAIRQVLRQSFFLNHLITFLKQVAMLPPSTRMRMMRACAGAAAILLSLCYARTDEAGNKLEEIDLLSLPLDRIHVEGVLHLLGRCKIPKLSHLEACRLYRILRKVKRMPASLTEATACASDVLNVVKQLKHHGLPHPDMLEKLT